MLEKYFGARFTLKRLDPAKKLATINMVAPPKIRPGREIDGRRCPLQCSSPVGHLPRRRGSFSSVVWDERDHEIVRTGEVPASSIDEWAPSGSSRIWSGGSSDSRHRDRRPRGRHAVLRPDVAGRTGGPSRQEARHRGQHRARRSPRAGISVRGSVARQYCAKSRTAERRLAQYTGWALVGSTAHSTTRSLVMNGAFRWSMNATNCSSNRPERSSL